MEEKKNGNETPVKYDTLLVYEGAKFKTLHTRKHKARKQWIPVNPAEVTSFIPGTVRKIFIKEGQIVKKGDCLLTLEAMKMLNKITASMDGMVKAVNVKTGVNVTKSQVLIELQEAPPVEKKKKRKKD